ncbi:type II toxin-antitoxin system VapB family antitoxin [Persephonella sp.]|uniref:antitoxin n=1 Tax=Persephonella sp. TaxID=2060922 RepID=UPI0025F61D1A|nr:type II toxin-antitoxin system VapB family antitoxin [Persephonella sp.]
MKKTKVFKSGNSLAVRLPKGYQIDAEEVYIAKQNNKLVIFPEKEKWDVLFDMLEELADTETKDFLKNRNQPKAQERDLF